MPSVDQVVSRFGKQRYLAISLFIYLIADAFVPGNRLLGYSILALMIITGPLAIGRSRMGTSITILLALLMVGFGYLSSFIDHRMLSVAATLSGTAFFSALIFLISRSLLIRQTKITGETLWAAINVYVLLGLAFAFLYTLIVVLEPGAFAGGILDLENQDIADSLLYYSFVTMTTLGYGDITPKIHVAATLAYVQALVGQLYVAILIARLVSLYSAQPGDTETDKE